MYLPTRRSVLVAAFFAFFVAVVSTPSLARELDTSISISGPSSAAAGTTVCVTVTCSAGPPAVKVEQGDTDIKVTQRQTEDGTIICFEIPPGTAGTDITVTATDSNGDVVTKTISVT